MRYPLLLAIAIPLLVTALSCNRYEDDVVNSDTDIVATVRNPDVEFSTLGNRYTIVDKINLVYDKKDPIDSVAFWNLYNQQLKDQVIANMTKLGYTLVDQADNPDHFVNMTAIYTVSTTAVYYPGWWWGYPGYPCNPYYSWWCGGGGYYPGYTAVYEYSQGSMVIELIDIPASEEVGIPVINWLAGLTRVLATDKSVNLNNTLKNIDQAFKQSPYLSQNQ